MKKTIYLLLAVTIFLSSCENSNETETTSQFSVDGKSYKLTNYILNQSVDTDGDGLFSFDIYEENNICIAGDTELLFNTNAKIYHPAWVGYRLEVNEGENGVMTQSVTCGFLDGILPNWKQSDNQLNVYDGLSDDLVLTGLISEDGQSITFDVPYDMTALTVGEGNQILTEEGNIINYEENVQLIFTLNQ